jgi:hypothetical protein
MIFMKYVLILIVMIGGYYFYDHFHPSSAGNWWVVANGKSCIKAGTPDFINTPATIMERFPDCKKMASSRPEWVKFDCSKVEGLSGVVFADGEQACRDFIAALKSGSPL